MSNAVLTYRQIPRALEEPRTGQAPLTFFLIVLFVLLRFLAGGRAVGEQETNLSVVFLGLGILAGLIMVNRPIALVLIVFDMVDMAGWINPAAWGIPGAFKFKDAEFVLLMVMGIIGLVVNSHLRMHRKTLLSRAMTVFAIVVGTYIIYTLTLQNLSITFRVARQLIYYGLFFVIPFYIPSEKELRIALRGFFVLMLASSTTHILQAVIFPIHALLPYTQSGEVAGGFVRLWGPSQPFNFIGVPLLFGVLLQAKRRRWFLITAFGICVLASLLTLGRTYVAYLGIGVFVILVLLSTKGLRVRNAVRYVSILAVSFTIVWILLSVVGRGDLVAETVSGRMEEAQGQFRVGEGTFFVHVEYASLAPLLIERNEGSLLFGLGFRGLPYDRLIAGGSPEEDFSPTFNSDNGWSGIFVSMGFVGLLFFAFFLITCARYTYRISQRPEFELACILSAALFAFFVLAWFLWFFSALGIWQDSAMVVAVAAGLLGQAVGFNPRTARI
ncbi:MAG: O-antigen polymerase [Bacteroidota bacterium]